MGNHPRRKPVLIIPACGKSQRFRERGIMVPKGLLHFNYDGHTLPMIHHVIPRDLSFYKVIVTVTKGEENAFLECLHPDIHVFAISNSVGQMDTVLQTLDSDIVPHDHPIVILNCDDKLPEKTIKELMGLQAQVGAVVFRTEKNPRYGYIDSFPEFTRGAEKDPISEYALAGGFMFESKHVFAEAVYASAKTWSNHKGEYYLSHLFEHVKGKKEAVLVSQKDIVDFGTPEGLSIALGFDIVTNCRDYSIIKGISK